MIISISLIDSSLSIHELLLDSSVSLGKVDSVVSEPFSSLGVLLDELEALLNDLSSWFLVASLLLSIWVGSDGSMNLLVEVLASLYLSFIEAFGTV